MNESSSGTQESLQSEALQPGDRLLVTRFLSHVDFAEYDEEIGYTRDYFWIDANDGNKGVRGFKVEYTRTYNREKPKPFQMSNNQMRRERAEGGTGPGGTKSPAYSGDMEFSRMRTEGPYMSLDYGDELEVVTIKDIPDFERKDIVFRYVKGNRTSLFPGGYADYKDSVPVDGIKKINGQKPKDFFKEHFLIQDYNAYSSGTFRKLPPEKSQSSFLSKFKSAHL